MDIFKTNNDFIGALIQYQLFNGSDGNKLHFVWRPAKGQPYYCSAHYTVFKHLYFRHGMSYPVYAWIRFAIKRVESAVENFIRNDSQNVIQDLFGMPITLKHENLDDSRGITITHGFVSDEQAEKWICNQYTERLETLAQFARSA